MTARTSTRNLLLLIIALCAGVLIGMYIADLFTPPDPWRRGRARRRTRPAGNISQWDKPIPTRKVG